MKRPVRHQRPPPRGFALAAVLWLLAGLAVLITSVSVSMLAVARTNRDLNERVRMVLAEQTATANLAFVLLTHRTLGLGAGVGNRLLPLDGTTPFTLVGGARVQLQDMQGLVALNSALGDDIRRLLLQCGATAQQADRLPDTLLDYTDEDSLKRLNGAEAFEYAGSGLPPPRNQFLVARDELWQAFDWASIRPAWQQRGCDDLVSLGPLPSVNLWTAPLQVLLAVGMDPAAAAAALAERDGMADAQRLSPLLMAYRDSVGTSLQAQSRFGVRNRGDVRVTIWLSSGGVARRFVLSRTGRSHLLPFVISEEEWLPAKSSAAETPQPLVGARAEQPLEGFVAAAAESIDNNNVQVSPFPFQRP